MTNRVNCMENFTCIYLVWSTFELIIITIVKKLCFFMSDDKFLFSIVSLIVRNFKIIERFKTIWRAFLHVQRLILKFRCLRNIRGGAMSVYSLNDIKFKAIAATARPSCVKSSTSIVNWTLEFKLPKARSNFAFNLRSDRISRVTFKYILFSWNETWSETNRTARKLEGRRFPVFLVHHFRGRQLRGRATGIVLLFGKFSA